MKRKVQLQLKHIPQCSLHRKLEATEFQELSVLVSGTQVNIRSPPELEYVLDYFRFQMPLVVGKMNLTETIH